MENGWSKVWEYYRQEGEKEGEKEGREAGILEGTLKCIKNLQKNEGWSFDEAADAIGVTDEDRALLKTMC